MLTEDHHPRNIKRNCWAQVRNSEKTGEEDEQIESHRQLTPKNISLEFPLTSLDRKLLQGST